MRRKIARVSPSLLGPAKIDEGQFQLRVVGLLEPYRGLVHDSFECRPHYFSR
jgi:hypothetical protein